MKLTPEQEVLVETIVERVCDRLSDRLELRRKAARPAAFSHSETVRWAAVEHYRNTPGATTRSTGKAFGVSRDAVSRWAREAPQPRVESGPPQSLPPPPKPIPRA